MKADKIFYDATICMIHFSFKMDVSLVPKSRKSALLPPNEDIETEGQRQLKALLDKQLQKNVTVEQ